MSETLPTGATFGGRWVIERPLSSGGMGAVYVAKHKETGRPVALKVIKLGPQASDELVSRFKRETGALAAVSHPNVVTFLDSGVEASPPASDPEAPRLTPESERLRWFPLPEDALARLRSG